MSAEGTAMHRFPTTVARLRTCSAPRERAASVMPGQRFAISWWRATWLTVTMAPDGEAAVA